MRRSLGVTVRRADVACRQFVERACVVPVQRATLIQRTASPSCVGLLFRCMACGSPYLIIPLNSGLFEMSQSI